MNKNFEIWLLIKIENIELEISPLRHKGSIKKLTGKDKEMFDYLCGQFVASCQIYSKLKGGNE